MTVGSIGEFRPWANVVVGREVQRRREKDGVLGQGIRWVPTSWQRTDLHGIREVVDDVAGLSEPVKDDQRLRLIRRRQVIEAFEGSLRRGFVATMIFGYGTVGYGASRVARIVRDGAADLDHRLAAIAQASLASDVTRCWEAFTGPAKLRGLGPAFATKFAYFAARANGSTSYPLIADRNTSWATWHFTGIPGSVEQCSSYARYVELARSIHGTEPDEVECALFTIGKSLNRHPSCRHTSLEEYVKVEDLSSGRGSPGARLPSR